MIKKLFVFLTPSSFLILKNNAKNALVLKLIIIKTRAKLKRKILDLKSVKKPPYSTKIYTDKLGII